MLTAIVFLRAARRRRFPAGSVKARPRWQPSLRHLLEELRFAWQLVVVALLLIAMGLLLTAGISVSVLGPRWLGALLLVVMALFLLAAVVELRKVAKLWHLRRLRRRAERLRHEV